MSGFERCLRRRAARRVAAKRGWSFERAWDLVAGIELRPVGSAKPDPYYMERAWRPQPRQRRRRPAGMLKRLFRRLVGR